VTGLISIQDIGSEKLSELITTGRRLLTGDLDFSRALVGRAVGLYFSKPSTRTRTSFFTAVARMGGQSLLYSARDLQTTTGEALEDTGMVLGLYLDAFVMRTNDSMREMRIITESSGGMPVINALSKTEHPTQAIADLITVEQEFGSLNGRHILYLGAWNNTASSLVLASTKLAGVTITVATPPLYAPPPSELEAALSNARASGAALHVLRDASDLPRTVDVIYTTRWASMGEAPARADWQQAFAGFAVSERTLERCGHARTIFMHDLPAHRDLEVTSSLLDGPTSRVRHQAFNKQIAAMSVLEDCLRTRPTRSI
jgi:ornithine carbamoyltransferase